MLDKLRPHESIKVLSIEHYVGAKFPQWMGDPSFSMMEVLTLENCKNCISLPSLGLLGLLKRLIIKRMKKIKSIGFEFYGKDYSKPFQSLETLCFEDLQEWECWDINGLVAGCSNLRKLSIVKCPKLSGKLPEHLPCLEELLVEKCSELIVSFSSYPILRKLEIDECKGLVCSTLIDSKLIDSMIISNSSLHVYGRKGMMHDDLTAAESRSVTTTNILELGKFLEQGFHQVKSLVMMSRVSRESRVLGWKNRDFYYELTYNKLEFQRQRHRSQRGIHVLTFTDEVSFEKGCVCLVRFPEIDFFLKNLRSLKIYGCSTLESLPKEITGTDSNSKLELLFISFCDSLTSIGKLPSSLKTLEIYDCEKLRRLFDGEEGASSSSSVRLKFLRISACPELTSLSLGTQSLEALEDLQIAGCPKLESIPDGLHKLNCLKRIKISSCPSIVSFPEGGLPNTISEFDIQDCEKLEALPNDMHNLNCLKYLRIRRCPSVVSFPGEVFPTNLTSLFIEIVKVYKPWIERGLHRLTSLTTLDIEGWDEEMEFMLPASLTHLSLRRFSKLKSLSSRYQSLTSLRSLVIDDCPNLKSFPEEGFPSSLAELCIIRCPMLKEACKRDRGKEWFKIAQIPFVWIDCKSIYEESESESE